MKCEDVERILLSQEDLGWDYPKVGAADHQRVSGEKKLLMVGF